MPIRIPDSLPAHATLESENIFVMTEFRAMHQDIRPLDVLILNGPTVGVDVGAKQDIHALVHDLANEGLAVIIISDDLSEVVVNCSRVLVMKDGSMVGEMTGEDITEENILEIIR